MNLRVDIKLDHGPFTLAVDVTLDGHFTGLFGPSGAGKTSLLHIIAGLERRAVGRVELDGRVLQDSSAGTFVPPHKRRIGVAFQDDRLFPHLSVRGNLKYGLARTEADRRRLTLEEVAELLEIDGLLARRVQELSGGERQRVSLGRALLMSPQLLLLDEPLGSLDRNLRRQILPFLRRVRDVGRADMLMVSHDLTEILELTRDLLVINNGDVIGCGGFLDLAQDPDVLPLMHDLGLLNVVELVRGKDCKVRGITFARPVTDPESTFLPAGTKTPLLKLPILDGREGDTLHVALPTDEIALSLQPVPRVSIQNQLPGRLVKLTRTPQRTVCLIDVGTRLLVEVTNLSVDKLDLREDIDVWCLFKSQALHLLS